MNLSIIIFEEFLLSIDFSLPIWGRNIEHTTCGFSLCLKTESFLFGEEAEFILQIPSTNSSVSLRLKSV